MPFSTTRRALLRTAVLGACALAGFPVRAQGARRILVVATNVGKVGANVSGTYLKEIAYPFGYFIEQGYAVDVLTPGGGKAALYHTGATPDALARIRDLPAFTDATARTLAPAQVRPEDYAGIYYPGGHGQFWDVVENPAVAAVAACIHAAGGAIGTAGHGAASLVNVRDAGGAYLVAGKRMTCFPSWAEKLWMDISEYGKLLPFDMEQVLRRRGADLSVCTRETMNDPAYSIVVDAPHRLVTGAFAMDARGVAGRMHALLAGKA